MRGKDKIGTLSAKTEDIEMPAYDDLENRIPFTHLDLYTVAICLSPE
jgi:hypothetical protein